MSEPSKDPKSAKTEDQKKQPETVLLSSEELKAIAGGAGVSTQTYTNTGTTTKPLGG